MRRVDEAISYAATVLSIAVAVEMFVFLLSPDVYMEYVNDSSVISMKLVVLLLSLVLICVGMYEEKKDRDRDNKK